MNREHSQHQVVVANVRHEQAIATNQFDAYTITTHIGSERAPSGRHRHPSDFCSMRNLPIGAVMSLNADKKPHNGQTVAGALKLASLLYQDLDAPSRIAEILQLFATFAGVPYLSCSVPAYLKFRSSSSMCVFLALALYLLTLVDLQLNSPFLQQAITR